MIISISGVKKALELCAAAECEKCTYKPIAYGCRPKLMLDALELLNEQEPMEPWLYNDGKEFIWSCRKCDAAIYHNGDSQSGRRASEYALFCRKCGTPQKWDDLRNS